jgi:hypothetical protein
MLGGLRLGESQFEARPGKEFMRPKITRISKITRAKCSEEMAQVVEHLLYKYTKP